MQVNSRRRWRPIFPLLVSLLLTLSLAQAHEKNRQWQQIPLSGEITITDPQGNPRTLKPACSGGPVCSTDPATGVETCRKGKTDFSFFVRPGKKDKVVLYFDGGGACWNSATCLIAPIYTVEIDETPQSLAAAGGIADIDNPNNPLRDWTQVFVPYCSGDIHWGAKETDYVDYTGKLGPPGGTVTLHHRGFDNALAVIDWLQKRYPGKKHHGRQHKHGHEHEHRKKLKKIFVSGSSAGGYGALLAFPYVKETWPDSRAWLLADAASGVITQDFLQGALAGENSSWGMTQNLPGWIPGYSNVLNLGALLLPINMYGLTTRYYPQSPMAQYTTSWDAVQTTFLHVMQNPDNPPVWQTPSGAAFCEWHLRNQHYAWANASAPNYRYYLAAGISHTILGDQALFNSEASAGGVRFTDWLHDMLDYEADEDEPSSWQNLECSDCAPPFEPALCGGV